MTTVCLRDKIIDAIALLSLSPDSMKKSLLLLALSTGDRRLSVFSVFVGFSLVSEVITRSPYFSTPYVAWTLLTEYTVGFLALFLLLAFLTDKRETDLALYSLSSRQDIKVE